MQVIDSFEPCRTGRGTDQSRLDLLRPIPSVERPVVGCFLLPMCCPQDSLFSCIGLLKSFPAQGWLSASREEPPHDDAPSALAAVAGVVGSAGPPAAAIAVSSCTAVTGPRKRSTTRPSGAIR